MFGRRKFLSICSSIVPIMVLPQRTYPIAKMLEMEERENKIVDAIIVGGGPAGLSAALFLSRAKRTVVVFDWGEKRIPDDITIHEYLGFENIKAEAYFKASKEEVEQYGTLFKHEQVVHIEQIPDKTFKVASNKGKLYSRTVILATGAKDILPNIPGLKEGWGHDIHICPCFTGYELYNKKLLVFGITKRAIHLAQFLTSWSNDVTLIINESPEENERKNLKKLGVKTVLGEVKEVKRINRTISHIETDDGKSVYTDGIFLCAPIKANSNLATSLCDVDEMGFAITDEFGKSSREGLWVIGNANDPIAHMTHASTAGTKVGPMVANYLVEQRLALHN